MRFATQSVFAFSIFIFLSFTLLSCQDSGQRADTAEPDSVLVRELQVSTPDIREGTDFYAFNHDDGWDLMIDIDEATARFSYTSEPYRLTMPLPESTSPDEIDAVSYMAQTEKANMQITIVEDSCYSETADKSFPYRVEVKVKTTSMLNFEELDGCGRYLEKYRLNGSWMMVTRNGEEIPSDLRPPSFTIDLAEGKVAGFTGCNRFEAQVEVRSDTLAVGPWMATEKNCVDMDLPQLFRVGLSGRPVKYQMEDQVLTLRIGEEEVWQLIRPNRRT